MVQIVESSRRHDSGSLTARPSGSGGELLAAKLVPPLLGFAPLRRPRLLRLLTQGVDLTPVTLLSGPAGSGKTVLAASWAQESAGDRSVAWLSVDPTDDDPAVFWPYVVAALGRAGVPLPAVESGVPWGASTPGWPLRLAAALTAQPRRLVLVVDNADCLVSRELTHALDLLVQHAGASLRLVLCARSDPLLPLHRYRLDDRLTEIRTDQLAFTPAEAGELLALLGVPVEADVATALQRETEGWAAALRLAAAPLSRGVRPELLVTSLTADDGSVTQYLVAEVLDHQPASVRRFLLRISATRELWPDLVDSLAGRPGGRRLLGSLAAANAFVERAGDAPGGFRIHALFRELLQAQLAYEDPGAFAAGHRTCAFWYAGRGRSSEAVEHAMTAGDEDLAARLLVDDLAVGHLVAHGPVGRTLPVGAAGPEGAVLRAAAALAEDHLVAPADLVVVTGAARDAHARPALRVCSAVLCALAAAAGPVADRVHAAAATAEALVAALPEEQARRRAELSALLITGQATALQHTDVPERVLREAVARALAAARSADAPWLSARCLADLALLEALVGRLRRTTALTADYEALADERRLPEAERASTSATAAAWAALDRHELTAARRWLARAAQRSPDPQITGPLVAVLDSRLRRAGGELVPAEHVLQPALDADGTPSWVREHVLVEAVRLQIARRDGPAVGALLARMPATSPRVRLLRGAAAALALLPGAGAASDASGDDRPGGPLPLGLTVEDAVVRACLLERAGDTGSAVATLAHALELATPERLRRPFLDAPPQLRPLLRAHPRLASAGAWLSPAAAAVPAARHPVDPVLRAPAAEAPPTVVLDLSPRELEVLQLIATMLSTAEIAAALFVSVNTVRTHVRSILRKLGTARRNEAVRRARELHLLQPPPHTAARR